jgi:hypothetical protein
MLARIIVVLTLAAAVFGVAHHLHVRETPLLETGPSHKPRGVFHLRADIAQKGLTALDALASRARAAGLSFVVITDPSSQLAGPVIRDGVVILSYGELTTPYGQLVGLGARNVLSAEERNATNVHQAVRALGGSPIISHPSDPKRPWTGDFTEAGGIEIASFPAAAREMAGPFSFGLVPLVLTAQANPRLALAQLYTRDRQALIRWDENERDRYVGLCGAGSVGALGNDQDLFTWNVVLDTHLPDDVSQRPQAVLDALQRGNFFCAGGLFGEAPYFEFGARHGNEWTGHNGDVVRDSDVTELTVLGPNTSIGVPSIVLLRSGDEVARVHGRELHYRDPAPGMYRVEVRVPVPYLTSGERHLPVIYSNRIHIVSTTLPGLRDDTLPETPPLEMP